MVMVTLIQRKNYKHYNLYSYMHICRKEKQSNKDNSHEPIMSEQNTDTAQYIQ